MYSNSNAPTRVDSSSATEVVEKPTPKSVSVPTSSGESKPTNVSVAAHASSSVRPFSSIASSVPTRLSSSGDSGVQLDHAASKSAALSDTEGFELLDSSHTTPTRTFETIVSPKATSNVQGIPTDNSVNQTSDAEIVTSTQEPRHAVIGKDRADEHDDATHTDGLSLSGDQEQKQATRAGARPVTSKERHGGISDILSNPSTAERKGGIWHSIRRHVSLRR